MTPPDIKSVLDMQAGDASNLQGQKCAVLAGHIADCRRHMRAHEGTFWPFKACNALPGRTDRS